MADRQSYVILSSGILPEEDCSKIIRATEGGPILRWLGDRENVERNGNGYYEYNLECAELTATAKREIISSLSLEAAFAQSMPHGTGTGVGLGITKNSDKPAFLRRIMDKH